MTHLAKVFLLGHFKMAFLKVQSLLIAGLHAKSMRYYLSLNSLCCDVLCLK